MCMRKMRRKQYALREASIQINEKPCQNTIGNLIMHFHCNAFVIRIKTIDRNNLKRNYNRKRKHDKSMLHENDIEINKVKCLRPAVSCGVCCFIAMLHCEQAASMRHQLKFAIDTLQNIYFTVNITFYTLPTIK